MEFPDFGGRFSFAATRTTTTHEPHRTSCRRLAVAAMIVAHLGVPVDLPAETSPKIDPAVRTAVLADRARVLVTLRIPGGSRPEGDLPTGDAISAQRAAIAAAQQTVLSRLAGTNASVARRYASVPLLALEIGADALAALETMGDLVVSAVADEAVPPSGAPRPR